MTHTLIAVIIFALVVVILVYAAIYIIERTLPGDVQWPAKLVVGALGLIAILYKLLPLAGL